ncbi:hypothetical protein [Kribbella jiaozuonensis]|uniref:Uncharacterized protein n=1 Tax=Kribbella jiaozuonensis TaxID=2575441 RepID=A0A4U3LZH1_9ACTN|nr:hypothetical protein [Kribbella jiaozuonensis]TKK81748.1 hypothetical protein FDA38_02630 [Kribbella jiaozuonensis]
MTIDAATEYAQGNNSDRPDPILTPLSRRQATRLVQLALSTAAELGLDLAYQGGAALVPADRSADNPVLGLSNLARIVAQFDEDSWPVLVEEHFDQLLEQLRQGPPTPPTDPERELIQRLVPRDALPPGWTADRPDFLPGLLSVPSTTDDGIVTMFLEPADMGITWSEAERFGLANLRRMTDHVEHVEHEDLQVDFVTGTPFAASRALVLDTVLRESLHVEHAPHGVLAAVPARDTLMLHVIRDLSLIPALGLLLNVAARSHAHDPGPLSPEVFMVTPDFRWLPATTVSPDYTPLRLSSELETLTKVLATSELPSRSR